MSSMNKVMVMGNLGADPKTYEAKNGGCICRFNLATHPALRRR